MAAGGVVFSNKDALIGARPAERSGAAIFARSRDLQPRLEPLVVPTASQIREFLPKGFNPQFVYENQGQEERDLASFVVVGPVTIKRVVGDYAFYERPDGEAATTQKYLEVEAIQKDPDKPFFGNPWLSFSNLLPNDLGSLIALRDSTTPTTPHSIIFPVWPPDEWRKAAIAAYQHSLGLSLPEATGYDKHALEVGASALAGGDVDAYFSTFSPDYVKPL